MSDLKQSPGIKALELSKRCVERQLSVLLFLWLRGGIRRSEHKKESPRRSQHKAARWRLSDPRPPTLGGVRSPLGVFLLVAGNK